MIRGWLEGIVLRSLLFWLCAPVSRAVPGVSEDPDRTMLHATADITLGSKRYQMHASEVIVTLGLLPGVGSFRATLPATAELSATPEDDAILRLDGGEGAETVLTGTIGLMRRGLLGNTITGVDAGALLGNARSASTFEKQEGAKVIRSLVADAGAKGGTVDIDLPLAVYVAHQGRTSAEHIASLAALAGCVALVDANGTVSVRPMPERPDIALRYGREIMDYQELSAPPPAAQQFIIGNGPAGSIQAPDVLHPSFERLPGSAAAPGPSARWRPVPAIRTASAATQGSESATRAVAAASGGVRATCFLLPAVRPGSVIELQDLPGGLSGGPWLVTRVRHRLHPGLGASTVFEGVAADAGSLLGSLVSAIGGLI